MKVLKNYFNYIFTKYCNNVKKNNLYNFNRKTTRYKNYGWITNKKYKLYILLQETFTMFCNYVIWLFTYTFLKKMKIKTFKRKFKPFLCWTSLWSYLQINFPYIILT